jgi:hypothetical protein
LKARRISLLGTYFSTGLFISGEAQNQTEKAPEELLVSCSQVVNAGRVINTPLDYTVQELLAQGKKLQNDRS